MYILVMLGCEVKEDITHSYPQHVGRNDWRVISWVPEGTLMYMVIVPSNNDHEGSFYVYNDKTTIGFCKAIGLSDENTILWVMKYGELLPTIAKCIE